MIAQPTNSFLTRDIYNNGAEEVIQAGRRAFQRGLVTIKSIDPVNFNLVFLVKDERYNNFYLVKIHLFQSQFDYQINCTCSFNLRPICRHKVSALLFTQSLIDEKKINFNFTDYNTENTIIKFDIFRLPVLKKNAFPEIFNLAQKIYKSTIIEPLKIGSDQVNATVHMDKKKYPIEIKRSELKNYTTSCPCKTEKNYPLCIHKLILLLNLLDKKGEHFWDSIKNFDQEKNLLLKKYGYSLADNLDNKFQFNIVNGQVSLKVLDLQISALGTNKKVSGIPQNDEINIKDKKKLDYNSSKTQILVLDNSLEYCPFFRFELCFAEINNNKGLHISDVEVMTQKELSFFHFKNDKDIFINETLRKIVGNGWIKTLVKLFPFQINDLADLRLSLKQLDVEMYRALVDYFYNKISIILKHFEQQNKLFILNGKKIQAAKISEIKLAHQHLNLFFKFRKIKDRFELEPYTTLQDVPISLQELPAENRFFIIYKNTIYLWESISHAQDAIKFWLEPSFCKKNELNNFYHNILSPLSLKYKIDFDKNLKLTTNTEIPKLKIILQEKEGLVNFRFEFRYNNVWIDSFYKLPILYFKNNDAHLCQRNKDEEEKLKFFVISLHPLFREQVKGTYVLEKSEIIKNGWFLDFINQLQTKEIIIENALDSNFKITTYIPEFKFNLSSGIDWFETDIQLKFGNEKIDLKEIKKMIEAQVNYINLSDGAIGLLPPQLLKSLQQLIQLGKFENQKFKIRHIHYNIIDELYDNLPKESIEFDELNKLAEVKKKFEYDKDIEPPNELQNILRPYQKEGFQWLNFLLKIEFGGILADDMGLGKTVQTLCILLHYFQTNKNLTALIICPYTLLFNWGKEITKFTSDLNYYIYNGPKRDFNEASSKNNQIIITSYGTIRSDIKLWHLCTFDFVILDESQIIKNPQSKICKAVQLLKAKHRFCLSGTPIQNSSFDLFAQMHFLNPGLLGSYEHFRSNFAIPIDRMQSQSTKDNLKKMVQPFILRRTKTMVTPDLPAKQEEIIICEMGEEQRSFYEACRLIYKEKIFKNIHEQGIKKSKFSILQGLMKLRQICDSPYLIQKTTEHNSDSIKIEELMHRLPENVVEHKVLIFSQFIDMMNLIKSGLENLNIPYLYLDGKCTMEQRSERIQLFQQDANIKVFVISLKTGGLGINLTSADYVYIVDPWWNPTVEDQAIDRTHRIGQTKKVFSYRMICKDTIEEKIMLLQQQKKSLVSQLMDAENQFVRSLTIQDLEYIFS